MTWGEFKEIIEDAGFIDDDKIFNINTGNNPDAEKLNISENEEGIEIWG